MYGILKQHFYPSKCINLIVLFKVAILRLPVCTGDGALVWDVLATPQLESLCILNYAILNLFEGRNASSFERVPGSI